MQSEEDDYESDGGPEDQSDDGSRNLSMEVTIPLDAHECVRRDCPRCGLEFKQAIAEADLSGILSASVGRLQAASRLASKAPDRPRSSSWCPYCGHKDESQAFMHGEHVVYLRRLIHREFFEPMMRKLFEPFENFRGDAFVKVSVSKGPRSTRPMLGPEPTDMVRIRCLNCVELFKIMPEWRGEFHCPSCGLELVGT